MWKHREALQRESDTEVPAILLALVFAAVLVPVTGETLILAPPVLIVNEGDVAALGCSPYFPNEPPILVQQMNLVFEDSRLSHQDFVSDTPMNGNRTYFLSNVSRADNNLRFRCIVGDVSSNEVRLQVYVLPELSGPSGTHYVLENSEAVEYIRYNITSSSPPAHSFIWLRNMTPFHGNSRVKLLDGNRTIAITAPSREDSGKYTFIVTSISGEATLELELQVIYDEFIEAPRDRTLEEGDIVRLICRHRFGEAYSWRTNRGSIDDLKTKVQLNSNKTELHYGPVSCSDAQLSFTCTVDPLGLANKTNRFVSAAAQLTVLCIPQVAGPKQVVAIENVDQELLLPFEVTSFPPYHTLEYTQDGLPLDLGSRGWLGFDNGSVFIASLGRRDAGEYKMLVTNERGNAMATLHLLVYYPPAIIPLEGGPFVFQVGVTAHVSCGMAVEGSPDPTFSWQQKLSNGRTTTLTNTTRYTIFPQTGVLAVHSALQSDSGFYLCTAVNIVGESTISVQLIVLEPPNPPLHVQVEEVGPNWVTLTWLPPVKKEGTTLSNYLIIGDPQPTVYNGNSVSDREDNFPRGNVTGDIELLNNSACIEFNCSVIQHLVSEIELRANVTGLVPAINYTMVVVSLAYGFHLRSVASPQVLFTTGMHVPGVGLVAATVHGPASASVTWSLAFSGGLPVTEFLVQYRRNNSSTWLPTRTEEAGAEGNQSLTASVSPFLRQVVVHKLEAAELYLFRVAASNHLGTGLYSEADEAILSHPEGVPSPLTSPIIKGWGQNGVVVSTSIPKLGSNLNFSLSFILLLGEVQSPEGIRTDLPPDYQEGRSVEVFLRNVTYRGDTCFQVIAFNYLGSSLPSNASLKARETIQAETTPPNSASIAVGSVMGIINSFTAMAAVIICLMIGSKSAKQKRSIARRLEMVKDHTANSSNEFQLSPYLLGGFRYSPDGRTILNQVLTPQRCIPISTTDGGQESP